MRCAAKENCDPNFTQKKKQKAITSDNEELIRNAQVQEIEENSGLLRERGYGDTTLQENNILRRMK